MYLFVGFPNDRYDFLNNLPLSPQGDLGFNARYRFQWKRES